MNRSTIGKIATALVDYLRPSGSDCDGSLCRMLRFTTGTCKSGGGEHRRIELVWAFMGGPQGSFHRNVSFTGWLSSENGD